MMGILDHWMDSRLLAAERRIVEGEMRLTRMRVVMTRLAESGHDTAEASFVSTEMERTLAGFYEDLRALRESLVAPDSSVSARGAHVRVRPSRTMPL